MKYLFLIFLVFSGLQVQAQLSPVAQDTFPWFVNYRLPTRVVGTKAPSSIFVMDSTQTKLRAIPTDSITSYIPRNELLGYKEYVAKLSQAGTDAPTVDTVLYNDLGGTVVWTYTGVGVYTGTLAGAFPTDFKTTFSTGEGTYISQPQESDTMLYYEWSTANTVNIQTFTGVDGAAANGALNETLIIIRVYN